MAFLTRWFSFFLAVVACLQSSTAATVFPDLYEASVLELQAGLDAGTFSSVDLVKVLPFFNLLILGILRRAFRLTLRE